MKGCACRLKARPLGAWWQTKSQQASTPDLKTCLSLLMSPWTLEKLLFSILWVPCYPFYKI